MQASVLGLPEISGGFIMETDASFKGLEAVVFQQQESGHVVLGDTNRAPKPCEPNMQYHLSMNLELVVLNCPVTQKYSNLLLGTGFVVYTNNNLLR